MGQVEGLGLCGGIDILTVWDCVGPRYFETLRWGKLRVGDCVGASIF